MRARLQGKPASGPHEPGDAPALEVLVVEEGYVELLEQKGRTPMQETPGLLSKVMPSATQY